MSQVEMVRLPVQCICIGVLLSSGNLLRVLWGTGEVTRLIVCISVSFLKP